MACEFCGGETAQLARTASRVWLGCSRCFRSWTVDGEKYRVDPSQYGGVRYQARGHQMSLARGSSVAALAVALALAVRMTLGLAIGNSSPFLLFTPAVAIAALYGGVYPGVMATALSTVVASHFFLTTAGEPPLEKWDRVVLFIVVGSVITGSIALLRRSRRELAASLWREQKARAMAEAADRTKDDFLALVSHELQTPISVVIGWLAAIRQHRLSPNQVDDAMDAIDRSTQILSRLVDDVLDRSRIVAGTLRLDLQAISLSTVVRAAVDQMHAKIDAAGLRLHAAIPTEGPTIMGDSIRLQQVFTNLLSNAVKFTPRGGLVSVGLIVGERDAGVVVADSGNGIEAAILPHIFEAYRQGRSTLAQSPNGLGLGLSIAKYLIDCHGGDIRATSAGPGLGAAFTVSLPLAERRNGARFPAPIEHHHGPGASVHGIRAKPGLDHACRSLKYSNDLMGDPFRRR